VVGIAAEPDGSAGVDLVSGARLALAGFAWPEVAPSIGYCCWHCWPDRCSGCSSYQVVAVNTSSNHSKP
jgi:hypothetical protein